MERDHLFISYAYEDVTFARWLALRLTSEGFKVWIDQFKLLGGESWPRDIDKAIKTRTFRVLGLLSKHSIDKPNPVKERTLALSIAKQPGREGFLIPINVDGLAPTELDWLTSDINFVQFGHSWSDGLVQLLKLLAREECPTQEGDGRSIVSKVAAASDFVTDAPETLISNVSPFTSVPEQLSTYIVTARLEDEGRQDVQRDWAIFPTQRHRAVAFHPPPEDLKPWLNPEEVRVHTWRECADIEGWDPEVIVGSLLRASVETHLRRLGYTWSGAASGFTVPGHHGRTMSVALPDGTHTTVKHSGERTFFRVGQPRTKYRYRLAVNLGLERGIEAEFAISWRLRFEFTDTYDEYLPEARRLSRRKHLTRDWYNRQWLLRCLAIIQHCSGASRSIAIGAAGDRQVVLDCRPQAYVVQRSIDETRLESVAEIGDDVPMTDLSVEDIRDEELDG